MLDPVARLFAALPASVRARRELSPLAFAAGDSDARSAHLHNLARNLALFDSARALLDAAEARGLFLLPLKGLVLAQALYGDIAARSMADLDVAVRPRDLERACQLMLELGWRRSFGDRARYAPPHGHDVSFTNADGHVLELHHRLYHELRADADVEPLFERAILVDLDGKPRRVPSWDDHLFLVAVHAATHAFGESAVWIIDVALLVGRASIENAEREAERRNAGFAFRAALRTAHRLLPEIPPPAARGDDHLRERLLDLILGRERMAAPPGQIQSLLARAVLTERPADALREILRKIELRAVELRERRR